MTSAGPYNQSYDMTHMYNFTDLRGCLPKKVVCPNTISGILNSNPNFSKFLSIVKKANM